MANHARQAMEVALAWLYDTEQPVGTILSHHGVTVDGGERRYGVTPHGWAGHPVIVVDVTHPAFDAERDCYTNLLEPDELSVLTGLLTGLGQEVVSTWNGHPSTTGSLALARPAHPSLIAAVDRYRAGCPDHQGTVFCGCGWYAAGNQLLVKPALAATTTTGE